MAAPRAVAKNLRRSATRLSKVVEPVVADAATLAIETASTVGGSFAFGGSRPYRMYATVTKTTNRRGKSSARVVGIPVGAWSMKSSGRRGGYDVRSGDDGPLDLRSAGYGAAESVHIASGTSGDGRWDRVVAAVNDGVDTITDAQILEALNG